MNNNAVKMSEKTSQEKRNMESWTSIEKENCKSLYGCEILIQDGAYHEVCTKEAPNDAYIVKYVVEDKICFDLTRGSRTRIFDMYWDKFRENLVKINFGYGRVNPKLWGYQKPEKKKRK